jgi:predicted phosphodiesterase
VSIIFIGDIHQQWTIVERGLAALEASPSAAVLLGDIQCERPLDELAAPLLDRGVAVHWIFGNHDNDCGPDMWANLADPARNPRTAPGALHGRVAEIAGMRVAGLGGTFRPRVWHPPDRPRLHRRAELADDVARMGDGWLPDHIAAVIHSLGSTAIWPEDYDALAAQRAEILVTHEAPASHPAGNPALDALARAMGARLIVHGHHHVTYRSVAADGLLALGVAAAWATGLTGEPLWRGEPPRTFVAPSDGWRFAA